MEAKMTKKGRELLCRAHAGDVQLSPISYIALGNGGCSGGEVATVTGSETALKQELIRKETASHQYMEETDEGTGAVTVKVKYTICLGETELAGESISEAGLLDADGNLVAYMTFLEKGKDEGMEFIFNMDEMF